MKKSTIWIIAIVMGLSFVGLLYLQISYIEEMAKMKKEQLDESVKRSLYQASRNLEMNETLRYLEKDVKETERKAYKQDSVMVDGLDGTIKHSHQFAVAADDGTVYSSFELKTFAIRPANVPKAMILRTDKNSISEASKSLQESASTSSCSIRISVPNCSTPVSTSHTTSAWKPPMVARCTVVPNTHPRARRAFTHKRCSVTTLRQRWVW